MKAGYLCQIKASLYVGAACTGILASSRSSLDTTLSPRTPTPPPHFTARACSETSFLAGRPSAVTLPLVHLISAPALDLVDSLYDST